ncbi:helix-turn-helix domain-containing protein [Actinokineospora sp. NBRC 105648]|uniref:arsenate reductase/protein-tyrosine-phosphatase family protein n=1 Tax=Actinokineospora sp. NBRC 105648 TaxID=3032206 RepID=UPI0024A159FA|nr:helix-turn-helix domain-containing protein [Actinokineospora sp. NBRC 105648]GLZ41090.1 putative regulatory protein, ArsR family [Actinokineospora sp. NBRC 105648]
MSTDWSAELAARARVHAALGEPARLAIVDRLLLGDASPGEVGAELGLSSNLLAHHVKQLELADLVTRSRSEGDHRRTYLRLRTSALSDLMPTRTRKAHRVVFVCSHNSARSQLAAALWAKRSPVPTTSAGTRPAESVHPLAVITARAHGLTLTHPQHVARVLRLDDLVVAVCDNAHEEMDPTDRLHWSVPDPAATGTETAFNNAYLDLADRVDRLAPAVRTPQGDGP